jgi:cytochrome c oxidase subunit 1
MYEGYSPKDKVLHLYTIAFLILFSIGGLYGVMIYNATVDILVHDTYYIVGHFHYVLSLGAIIRVKLGFYLYNKVMFGLKIMLL